MKKFWILGSIAAVAIVCAVAFLTCDSNVAPDQDQPAVMGSDDEGADETADETADEADSSSGDNGGTDGYPASIEVEGENVTLSTGKDSDKGTSAGTSGSSGSGSPGTSGSE